MGSNSKIEWCDATANPIRARRLDTGKVGTHCERVSPACVNCYAARQNRRNLPFGTGLDYTVPNRDQVEMFCDDGVLEQVLRWRQPQRIFWCSMTDLFGEFIPPQAQTRCLATMEATPQHTHLILTKRAKAMCEFFRDCPPPSNVWLGVTAENQQYADERIPDLLRTPAAVRFVSVEPLLGPLDLEWPESLYPDGPPRCCNGQDCGCMGMPTEPPLLHRLHWVIVGGESGPGARPMDLDWARSLRDQCRKWRVAVFMKQICDKRGRPIPFEEFPADLQIREFPEATR